MTPDLVVDTSVLIAIFKSEPEAYLFEHVLVRSSWAISTGSLLEARIWLIRNPGLTAFDPLPVIINESNCQRIAFGPEHETLAASVYSRFGKGRHPAQLNYGDCMAYATAQALGLPLLFKGVDFAQTDVTAHPSSAS